MSDSDRGERNQDLGQGFAIVASIVLCCLIVSVVTSAWVTRSGDRDQRAEHYQAEAERNQQSICVGRTGGLLAECLEEQRRASRDAYTAEKDLKAQRDMAFWALWMFVISAITALLTLWALWYVRGTLKATREALDDTGNATRAMVRQNELTEKSQRPWVGIEAKPILLQMRGNVFRIDVDLLFKNFGQLPALSVCLRFKVVWTDGTTEGIIEEWWDKFKPEDKPGRGLILPKDTLTFQFWAYQNLSLVPWHKTEDREYTIPLLIVSAFYRSTVTGEEWLRTDKAYAIAHKGDHRRTDTTFERQETYNLTDETLIMEPVTFTNVGH